MLPEITRDRAIGDVLPALCVFLKGAAGDRIAQVFLTSCQLLESALRAGCSVAAGTLTGAHNERQLVAAGATHVVSSVTDFADLLLKG